MTLSAFARAAFPLVAATRTRARSIIARCPLGLGAADGPARLRALGAVVCLVAAALLAPPRAAAQGGVAQYDFAEDLPMTEDTLRFEAEAVWGMVPGVFHEIGIRGYGDPRRRWYEGSLDVKRRLFGRRNREYFTCAESGSGRNAADDELILVVQMRVAAAAAGATILETGLVAHARPRGSLSYIECTSTGALEKALAARVTQLLQAMPSTAP
jgi:hypothetical protein